VAFLKLLLLSGFVRRSSAQERARMRGKKKPVETFRLPFTLPCTLQGSQQLQEPHWSSCFRQAMHQSLVRSNTFLCAGGRC
jgi:hypothetical protein